MRVLHVLNTLSPRYGGPVVAVNALADGLVQQGLDITIATTTVDWPSRTDLPGPVGIAHPYRNTTLWRFPVAFRRFLYSPALARWLRAETSRFDLVHIHELYRHPQWAASQAAQAAGIPYIRQPHGSLLPVAFERKQRRWGKRVYEQLVEWPSFRRAAAMQATTLDEATRLRSLMPETPLFRLPVGLDLSAFETLPKRGWLRARLGLGDEPIVLHFGRIAPIKGLDILVQACATLKAHHPDLCLVLAGPDNEGFRGTVEGWAAEAGIKERVIFADMIPHADRARALIDADVFALTSRSENFGIAVAEAIAVGLPVVVSRQASIWREVDGLASVFTVPLDPAATARALDLALKGGQSLRQQALADRRFAWQNYETSVVAREMAAIYRDLLAGRTQGRAAWDRAVTEDPNR